MQEAFRELVHTVSSGRAKHKVEQLFYFPQFTVMG